LGDNNLDHRLMVYEAMADANEEAVHEVYVATFLLEQIL